MANKTINVDALCPFFIADTNLSISCEGVISPRTVNKFESTEKKNEHERLFCTSVYENCRHCKAVMKNYI